jgi:hypothetical protein
VPKLQEGAKDSIGVVKLTKAELLLLKHIHLFTRGVLLEKKLEIEETKTTYVVVNF